MQSSVPLRTVTVAYASVRPLPFFANTLPRWRRWHPTEQAVLLTAAFDRQLGLLDVRQPKQVPTDMHAIVPHRRVH